MGRDLAFGSATLALSAAYYWMAAAIPESQLADAIGPQGLPRTYAVLLGGLSLMLMVRSIGARVPSPEPRAPLWRVAGMLAIGVVYILVAPWLGYLLSIAALILATTYYQGGAINRQVAVVALSGGIFFWLLFVVMMGIQQPPGWWPPPL
jgi:putative tricarboxylic transport membrane protein